MWWIRPHFSKKVRWAYVPLAPAETVPPSCKDGVLWFAVGVGHKHGESVPPIPLPRRSGDRLLRLPPMRHTTRLIRHLEQRNEELAAENARLRAAVVELTDTPAAEKRPIMVWSNPEHDELHCNWQEITRTGPNSGQWKCEHGVVLDHHPDGYCDGGCCR
jgi:hypothetical protein